MDYTLLGIMLPISATLGGVALRTNAKLASHEEQLKAAKEAHARTLNQLDRVENKVDRLLERSE